MKFTHVALCIFIKSWKLKKMTCLREKPLIVCNLSSTYFGPLWAITNQLQIMIMRSVKDTILHISTNYLFIYRCKNMKC